VAKPDEDLLSHLLQKTGISYAHIGDHLWFTHINTWHALRHFKCRYDLIALLLWRDTNPFIVIIVSYFYVGQLLWLSYMRNHDTAA